MEAIYLNKYVYIHQLKQLFPINEEEKLFFLESINVDLVLDNSSIDNKDIKYIQKAKYIFIELKDIEIDFNNNYRAILINKNNILKDISIYGYFDFNKSKRYRLEKGKFSYSIKTITPYFFDGLISVNKEITKNCFLKIMPKEIKNNEFIYHVDERFYNENLNQFIYKINYKKYIKDEIKINYNKDNFERIDLTNENVMSVDNWDTQDIDDCFSYKINNDEINLKIHIADPSSYFDFKNNYNMLEYYTQYINPKKRMLGDIEEHISLNENMKRNAITMDIKIKGNNFEYIIYESIIINKNKYNYDEFILNDDLIFLLNKVNNILKIKSDEYESHIFIQRIMLLYNYLFADFLLKNKIKGIFYSILINNSNNNNFINTPSSQFWKNIQNQTIGIYSYEPNKFMDLNFYTHSTSPLRRYVDLYNQYQLKCFLHEEEELPLIDLYILNSDNLNMKRVYKDLSYFNINKSEYEGKIIKINIEKNKLNCYIEELKIFININIISPINFDKDYINFNNNILTIFDKNIDCNKNIKIKLIKNEKEFYWKNYYVGLII